MPNVLVRKLELFGPLPAEDKRLVDEVVCGSRRLGPRQDITHEGDSPTEVRLILEGFACRYKLLRNGRRQIMAYLVPGDLCDFQVFILNAMDHSIGTLSPCTVVDIPRSKILELSERPAIARALWWMTLVDEATLREWLVNIGQRNAPERIAHLFCEIHLRLETVGLAEVDRFKLPITQVDIANTMGLSPVHVSRALRTLRERNLVVFEGRTIIVPNLEQLKQVSGFNPNYLHLKGGKHDPVHG